jgi:hypothetical protein
MLFTVALYTLDVDPLSLVADATARGSLPERVFTRLRARLPILMDAVSGVEAASGLTYPPYYLSPTLTLAQGLDGLAILYSRTIPLDSGGRLTILVEFSTPLLLYGTKATIEAVAAHEFLHYVDLVDRFTKMRVSGEPPTAHTFEASYQDLGALADPQLILRDRRLTRLLKTKFRPNIREKGLDEKVWRGWVQRNMPVRRIRLEENVVRVSIASILNTRFDEKVLLRLREIGGRGGAGR